MIDIDITGHITINLRCEFAEIPLLGHSEEWKPISKIKKHMVCYLRTGTEYPLMFGTCTSVVVKSTPRIKDNYVEFDFADFM